MDDDHELLIQLAPDGVLFVGDLGEADVRLVKAIKNLNIPTALILGNHDRGYDLTGELLRLQLNILGNIHCGWGLRNWQSPKIAVVGARPCSAGGGFYLSPEVVGVFGPITLQESVNRIVLAAEDACEAMPLVILAHSGPTGLGSDADSPCGRDWRLPAVDWGDKDLELAIDQIRKKRIPDLVVFGHMHHSLKRGNKARKTFFEDRWGTIYLNAACVPRRKLDKDGNILHHLSWVQFLNGHLDYVSHRWFRNDTSIASEEILLNRSNRSLV